MNKLTNKVRTYERMNVTQILHCYINLCIKCVFNARYQCMKCTNLTQFPLLNREMLSL